VDAYPIFRGSTMTDGPRSPWSEPRVSAFFSAHPDRVPRVPSFVPAGWDDPVADALDALLEIEHSSGVSLRIAQIKEKFGGLRIYVDVDERSAGAFEVVKSTPMSTHFRNAAAPGSVRERVHAIVDAAAERAQACCIRCGAPATRQRGFYRYCAKPHRVRTL
jgi:hypothetical protein